MTGPANVRMGSDLRQSGIQLRIFRGRARSVVRAAGKSVADEMRRGSNEKEALVAAAVELGRWGYGSGHC